MNLENDHSGRCPTGNSKNGKNTNQSHKEQRDLLMNKREVRAAPHTIHKRKQSQRVINDLDNVDFIPSNVKSSHQEA